MRRLAEENNQVVPMFVYEATLWEAFIRNAVIYFVTLTLLQISRHQFDSL